MSYYSVQGKDRHGELERKYGRLQALTRRSLTLASILRTTVLRHFPFTTISI